MPIAKYPSVLAAAEAAVHEKAASALSDLAAARERLTAAEIEHEAATDHLEEVESCFRYGGDDFTDLEHAQAVSRVRRSELAIEGSAAAIARGERLSVNTDAQVARVVADYVSQHADGITVAASFTVPDQGPKSANELPVMLFVQREATTVNPDGTVSAILDVHFFRSHLHRPLRTRGVAELLDGFPWAEVADDARSNAEGTHDRITVRVRGAHLALPNIARIDAGAAAQLPRIFAQTLAGEVRDYGSAAIFDPSTGAIVSSHVTALGQDSEIVAEEIDGDRRTVTVESLVLVQERKQTSGRTMTQAIDRVMDMLSVDEFVSGLGVVESMELVGGEHRFRKADPRKASAAIAAVNTSKRPTPVSALTDLAPMQVVIRTKLVSRASATTTEQLAA